MVMDVDTSLKILVIILSSTLALFLILAIILTIKLIQVANHLKVLVVKAEALTEKAGHIGELFQKSAAPMAIGRLLANIHEAVFSKKGKR
jgi:hypothetical protein